MVVPAGGKFGCMGELVPFARAKFKGGGSVGYSAQSKLRVVKLLVDEISAVRRRIRTVRGGRGVSGEGGGVFKQEQWVRVVVECVRDGGSGGFDSVHVVAATVVNGRAKVKCAVTMVGPARSRVGAEMSDTQLSRWVEGMGTKVKLVAM